MNIDELINSNYTVLNENDLHIWHYIANNKAHSSNCTIEELAKYCNVSKTSIIRFAKKLSLQGFSELKIRLKMETNKEYSSIEDTIDSLCNGYYTAIDAMRNRNCDTVCKLLYEANHIFAYGSGIVQLDVAKNLKRTFYQGGKLIYYFEGSMSSKSIAAQIHPGDVVILISMNGESENIVNIARSLKLKNIKLISMTKLKNNTLASICDTHIYFTNEVFTIQTSNRDCYLESTASMMMMIEILFLKYQDYVSKRDDCK